MLCTHAAPGSCNLGAHLRVGFEEEGEGRRVWREGALLPLPCPSGPGSHFFDLALMTPGNIFSEGKITPPDLEPAPSKPRRTLEIPRVNKVRLGRGWEEKLVAPVCGSCLRRPVPTAGGDLEPLTRAGEKLPEVLTGAAADRAAPGRAPPLSPRLSGRESRSLQALRVDPVPYPVRWLLAWQVGEHRSSSVGRRGCFFFG